MYNLYTHLLLYVGISMDRYCSVQLMKVVHVVTVIVTHVPYIVGSVMGNILIVFYNLYDQEYNTLNDHYCVVYYSACHM